MLFSGLRQSQSDPCGTLSQPHEHIESAESLGYLPLSSPQVSHSETDFNDSPFESAKMQAEIMSNNWEQRIGYSMRCSSRFESRRLPSKSKKRNQSFQKMPTKQEQEKEDLLDFDSNNNRVRFSFGKEFHKSDQSEHSPFRQNNQSDQSFDKPRGKNTSNANNKRSLDKMLKLILRIPSVKRFDGSQDEPQPMKRAFSRLTRKIRNYLLVPTIRKRQNSFSCEPLYENE